MSNVLSMADFKAKRSDREGRDWTAGILSDLEADEADPVLMDMIEQGYAQIVEVYGRDTFTQCITLRHDGDETSEEEMFGIYHMTGDETAIELLTVERTNAAPRTIRDVSDAEIDRRVDLVKALTKQFATDAGNPSVTGEWPVYMAFMSGAIHTLITMVDTSISEIVVEDGVLSFAIRVEDSTYNVRQNLHWIVGYGSGQLTIERTAEKSDCQ